MKFFLLLNEQQVGPYDAGQVFSMLAQGEISLETLCMPEEGGDWVPVAEISALEAAALEVDVEQGQSEAMSQAPETVAKSKIEITLLSGEVIEVAQFKLCKAEERDSVSTPEKLRDLLSNGLFFPVGEIRSIEHPVPALWYATRTGEPESGPYVHSGDDFVAIRTNSGEEVAIRWSAVAKYGARE